MTQHANTATDNYTEKGMRVYVLRAPAFGDCTNNGISARHTALTVVGIITPGNEADNKESDLVDINRNLYITRLPKDSRVFAPSDYAPAAVLRYSNGWTNRDHKPLHLAPLDACLDGTWLMAGGNYAEGSDSRWTALLRTLTGSPATSAAVPIHDRIER